MRTLKTIHLGSLRAETTHLKQDRTVTTDVAESLGGIGHYLSPSSVLAASVANCKMSMLASCSARKGFPIEGARIETDYESNPDGSLKKLSIDLYLPQAYDEKTTATLEAWVHSCPVRKSLHPEVEVAVAFHYGV